MITHELMRELLSDNIQDIQEIAEFVPNEIVYKALIIREFMKERGIEDPRQGIREFYAFERERLRKLGFVATQEPGSKQKQKASSQATS
ncbi:MAG: hypothetical protein DMG08_19330 [Acidobacteria bacterium]|nr:MAG: hypothetical protein DMG08_19330 [Acidobacteriota bacterium]PYV42507.1 MAG: hypothetical protein DMG09_02380 [Acidobacteriota bacterium]